MKMIHINYVFGLQTRRSIGCSCRAFPIWTIFPRTSSPGQFPYCYSEDLFAIIFPIH